jgi:glutathione S-transferase
MPQDARLKVFHIEGRRSFRVVWACEELGLPYDLVFKPLDIVQSLGAIRAANPAMPMSPTVEIDGQLIVESGAILDILTARAGAALTPPVASTDFLFHTQWMHFAEGTAQSRMMMWRMVAGALGKAVDELPQGYSRDEPGKLPDPDDPLAAFSFLVGPRAIFAMIEDYLGRRPFFGGASFSTADIMMHYQIRPAPLICDIDLADYPATSRWKALVEQRPAFARADKAAHPTGVDEYGLPLGLPLPFMLRRKA